MYPNVNQSPPLEMLYPHHPWFAIKSEFQYSIKKKDLDCRLLVTDIVIIPPAHPLREKEREKGGGGGKLLDIWIFSCGCVPTNQLYKCLHSIFKLYIVSHCIYNKSIISYIQYIRMLLYLWSQCVNNFEVICIIYTHTYIYTTYNIYIYIFAFLRLDVCMFVCWWNKPKIWQVQWQK